MTAVMDPKVWITLPGVDESLKFCDSCSEWHTSVIVSIPLISHWICLCLAASYKSKSLLYLEGSI